MTFSFPLIEGEVEQTGHHPPVRICCLHLAVPTEGISGSVVNVLPHAPVAMATPPLLT